MCQIQRHSEDFDALQSRVVPLGAPPIPRTDDMAATFITAKQQTLDTWLASCVKHPVVGISQALKSFLMQDNITSQPHSSSSPSLSNNGTTHTSHTTSDYISQGSMDYDILASVSSSRATSQPQPVRESKHSNNTTEGGKSIRLKDFVLLKVIGKGSFGKVMLVRKIDTQKVCHIIEIFISCHIDIYHIISMS